MAGYEIVTPSAGSTDWTSFEDQVAKARNGIMQLSLNLLVTGTTAPKISAGSITDVSGSLFYFASTEAITGSPSSSNKNYIMLTTSSSQITASWSTEVPSWVASKNGWYDATGGKRMVGVSTYDGTNYSNIGLLPRGESVWDKRGHELVALQMETKINSTGYTLGAGSGATYAVPGFSWTPTAVISVHVSYGSTNNVPQFTTSYPSKSNDTSVLFIAISNIGIDTVNNEVDVSIWSAAGASVYIEHIIVTAVRAL